MGVSLDDEEKGILKYLGNYDEAVGLESIKRYLNNQGYGGFTSIELIEKLDNLANVGYVRSKTEGKGDKREEKFYLSRVPLGGKFKRRSLQGRGIVHDTSNLVKRIFGCVFLLMGIGLLAYEAPNLTGAVIGVSTSGFLVGWLFILIALMFFFIKPKKSKKRR